MSKYQQLVEKGVNIYWLILDYKKNQWDIIMNAGNVKASRAYAAGYLKVKGPFTKTELQKTFKKMKLKS